MEIEYGAAEGANLGSTKEYSTRAFQVGYSLSIHLSLPTSHQVGYSEALLFTQALSLPKLVELEPRP